MKIFRKNMDQMAGSKLKIIIILKVGKRVEITHVDLSMNQHSVLPRVVIAAAKRELFSLPREISQQIKRTFLNYQHPGQKP